MFEENESGDGGAQVVIPVIAITSPVKPSDDKY